MAPPSHAPSADLWHFICILFFKLSLDVHDPLDQTGFQSRGGGLILALALQASQARECRLVSVHHFNRLGRRKLEPLGHEVDVHEPRWPQRAEAVFRLLEYINELMQGTVVPRPVQLAQDALERLARISRGIYLHSGQEP